MAFRWRRACSNRREKCRGACEQISSGQTPHREPEVGETRWPADKGRSEMRPYEGRGKAAGLEDSRCATNVKPKDRPEGRPLHGHDAATPALLWGRYLFCEAAAERMADQW